jgi:hypothetical protein
MVPAEARAFAGCFFEGREERAYAEITERAEDAERRKAAEKRDSSLRRLRSE